MNGTVGVYDKLSCPQLLSVEADHHDGESRDQCEHDTEVHKVHEHKSVCKTALFPFAILAGIHGRKRTYMVTVIKER